MKWIVCVTALILATSTPVCAVNLAPDVSDRVDKIVSIFENDSTVIRYDYIEHLDDGRGYTAGRSGFTTATGDLLDVVEKYNSHAFDSILDVLKDRAKNESEDVSGLEQLPQLWAQAAQDPVFRTVQDQVNEELYRVPVQELCEKLNLKDPLSFLVLYDSMIQHGDDKDDADSLPSLIAKTPASTDERSFIQSFLEIRRADLLNPANKKTTEEWRKSVGRIDALEQLVNTNKWTLEAPLHIDVWGEGFDL